MPTPSIRVATPNNAVTRRLRAATTEVKTFYPLSLASHRSQMCRTGSASLQSLRILDPLDDIGSRWRSTLEAKMRIHCGILGWYELLSETSAFSPTILMSNMRKTCASVSSSNENCLRSNLTTGGQRRPDKALSSRGHRCRHTSLCYTQERAWVGLCCKCSVTRLSEHLVNTLSINSSANVLWRKSSFKNQAFPSSMQNMRPSFIFDSSESA